jgi:hypothetical protein
MPKSTNGTGTGTGRLVEMPLAELLEDMTIYPRRGIDATNVKRLVLALEAGVTLPPVVADAQSHRIVDGWHRVRAFTQVRGATAVIPVELRTYTSEADLFLDAVRLNATHGRRLDKVDTVRIVSMADRIGISSSTIAAVLHMPEETVSVLRLRVALAPHETDGTIPGTTKIVLKAATAHLAGQTLTEGQAAAAQTAPGTSYLLLAIQLRRALEEDLIDRENDRLLRELAALQHVLGDYLTRWEGTA